MIQTNFFQVLQQLQALGVTSGDQAVDLIQRAQRVEGVEVVTDHLFVFVLAMVISEQELRLVVGAGGQVERGQDGGFFSVGASIGRELG